MDKLKMEARPMDEVLKKVAAICPAAVQGDKIDFERLKQELEPQLDESAESYNFTWVGKRDAIIGATLPIRKTLRPCKEESKNWDTTKNLYIEGDNLDVLKLLQESYLGKVKMIYLDPPYNTGNDFVYCDDFADSCKEYLEKKGQCDLETHERLFKNDESKGRFHSNWCTMMYPRLKVARDLLSDDGVVFISIDDHEVANLKKICDEIFGEDNFIAQFVWIKKSKGSHLSKTIRSMTEYVLAYAKSVSNVELFGEKAYEDKQQPLAKKTNSKKTLVFPSNIVKTTLKDGVYEGIYNDSTSAVKFDKFEVSNGIVVSEIRAIGPFVWTQEKLDEEISLGTDVFLSSKFGFNVLRFNQEDKIKRPSTLIDSSCDVGTNESAYSELEQIFGQEAVMSYPKPVSLLKYLTNALTHFDSDVIVLDFFAGSSTTAHAVMQLNAEDGGKRRFIMVQLPELCDEQSEAFKAGYKNICEIGKERIRRAGDKIVAETGKSDLDIGFKVLKLADSNMENVYYNPSETTQANLLDKVNNIKQGRTELDLLYGVMLDLGLTLELDVAEVKSGKTTYYNVDNGSLVACFADNIPESMIKEIAGLKPFRVVFKDSSFADAPAKINVTEIFKTMSPNTKITVL